MYYAKDNKKIKGLKINIGFHKIIKRNNHIKVSEMTFQILTSFSLYYF